MSIINQKVIIFYSYHQIVTQVTWIMLKRLHEINRTMIGLLAQSNQYVYSLMGPPEVCPPR